MRSSTFGEGGAVTLLSVTDETATAMCRRDVDQYTPGNWGPNRCHHYPQVQGALQPAVKGEILKLAKAGDLRRLAVWIEGGFHVDMPLNEARETVLHVATRRSDKPMIHYLLSARADPVNVKDMQLRTPISIAQENNQAHLVDLFSSYLAQREEGSTQPDSKKGMMTNPLQCKLSAVERGFLDPRPGPGDEGREDESPPASPSAKRKAGKKVSLSPKA